MTKLLEEALETVRKMPPADQDDIARAIFGLARIGDARDVDPEHWQEVLQALEAVDRGERASPEDVAAAFRSFDP